MSRVAAETSPAANPSSTFHVGRKGNTSTSQHSRIKDLQYGSVKTNLKKGNHFGLQLLLLLTVMCRFSLGCAMEEYSTGFAGSAREIRYQSQRGCYKQDCSG